MFDKLRKEFKDKKVLVVGLGLQGGGLGVAKFFAELGARVTITDKKTQEELQSSVDELKSYDISYTLGRHDIKDFSNADVIFKGPSVPWDMPEIQSAIEKGVPVEMESSFFAEHCPAKIIGITGTRGKSTTTHMIYESLRQMGRPVHLAGNIPGTSTIALLTKVKADDLVVLELSSWQLSGFHRKKISPHISVFTNIYPDHLNYYKTMEEYSYDKKAIYLYQKSGDFLIANESLKNEIEKDKSRSEVHYFSKSSFQKSLTTLCGDHNLENAAAALEVVRIIGGNEEKAAEIIRNYKGLPYRQQLIRAIGQVSFVNDTTSTTPIATVIAIKSFQDKPMVLIFGGNTKGLPTDDLIKSFENVDSIILLKGTLTDELLPTLEEKYADKISEVYDDFEKAIASAYEKGICLGESIVLLSPGATSFAMFKNEFHRGDEFNRIVGML